MRGQRRRVGGKARKWGRLWVGVTAALDGAALKLQRKQLEQQ